MQSIIYEPEKYGEMCIKPVTPGMGFGLRAPTGKCLKEWLHSIKFDGATPEEWLKKHDVDFLTITLECGCVKRFKSPKDVPLHSIQCEHGNYFIQIEKEEVND